MAPFNPYHKWLSIPPEQQPANHYRLLGVEDFEFDADVIETAAERQTLLLRTFQTGPNSELAERLLNEVSEARVCLLTPEDKAPYDKRLQSTSEPGQPVVAEEPPAAEKDWSFATVKLPNDKDRRLVEPEQLDPLDQGPLGYSPDELLSTAGQATSDARTPGKQEKPFWQKPLFFPLAGIGVVVVVVLLMLLTSGGDPSRPGDKPEVADKQNGLVTSQQDEDQQAKIPAEQAAVRAARGEAAAEKAAAEKLAAQKLAAQKAVLEKAAAAKLAAEQASAKAAAEKAAMDKAAVDAAKRKAEVEAKKKAEEILARDPITNSIGMKLKLIPAGAFMMGSPEGETDRRDDEYQHKVTITKAFYMQATEVTQGQWKAVMGTEPWKGKQYVKEGPDYAATYVSWNEAVAYCKKLSEIEGKTYRLPTEAEWEYACRAGTKTTWSFGNDEKALGDYAWYHGNAYGLGGKYAHQVRLKRPNAFGLFDMHGNVWEWCHDYYGESFYKQSPEQDPRGPARGSSRVLRGGSWNISRFTRYTRSAFRIWYDADFRYSSFGFRVVRELE